MRTWYNNDDDERDDGDDDNSKDDDDDDDCDVMITTKMIQQFKQTYLLPLPLIVIIAAEDMLKAAYMSHTSGSLFRVFVIRTIRSSKERAMSGSLYKNTYIYCLYVFMIVYWYVCLYVYVYIQIHESICCTMSSCNDRAMSGNLCLYFIFIRIHKYVYIHAYMFVRALKCLFIYTYTYINVYIIHKHIYTYCFEQQQPRI